MLTIKNGATKRIVKYALGFLGGLLIAVAPKAATWGNRLFEFVFIGLGLLCFSIAIFWLKTRDDKNEHIDN